MNNTTDNQSFSTSIPNLQVAWDSTSLGMLKTCPRYYQYSLIEGRQGLADNIHVHFGQLYHAAHERFAHARAQGRPFDDCLLDAISYALEATWDYDLNRPWISDLPEKNRLTLLRSLVWYYEEFREDSMETVLLSNGKPAVELSFRFDSGRKFSSGEDILLCGHLDRIGIHNDRAYVNDHKTTKHYLNDTYFSQYTPDNQISLYSIAGEIVYDIQVQGVIIDAVQLGATFARFARQEVTRDRFQKDEWMKDLSYWLAQAETYALTNYWPQNDRACFNCGFRPICSKSGEARDLWLKASFKHRTWDPLKIRGDI